MTEEFLLRASKEELQAAWAVAISERPVHQQSKFGDDGEAEQYSEKMSRWKREATLAIKDPTFWAPIAFMRC